MAALFINFAEFYSQYAFAEFRRHTDKRRHPHPEDRTRATNGDCNRHTGDITRTDRRRERRHQRAKWRDISLVLVVLMTEQLAECVWNFTDWHKAEANSEIKTGAKKEKKYRRIINRTNEGVSRSPDETVNGLKNLNEAVHDVPFNLFTDRAAPMRPDL